MKYKEMGPWHAAIYCTVLSGLVVIVNLLTYPALGGINGFLCFLPMCFFFSGAYMAQLRKDNEALRQQIDDLLQATDAGRDAA